MKTFSLPSILKFSSLGCAVLLAVNIPSAQAAPRGPSARAAARLKKYPPNTWIKHYLPDDRYKIAGNVWKYVTTDVDQYYHRPDSPKMLSQSPNQVIGFASAKDAEEAGYAPDPTDGTTSAVAGFDSSSVAKKTVRRLSATRITLSDGVSTVVIPAGWKHIGSQQLSEQQMSLDAVASPNGEILGFCKMYLPFMAGKNVEQYLTLQWFNQAKNGDSSNQFANITGIVSSNMSRAKGNAQRAWPYASAANVRIGGMSGLVLREKKPEIVNGRPSPARTYLIGRGATMVMIFDSGRSIKTNLPILKTLRVR